MKKEYRNPYLDCRKIMPKRNLHFNTMDIYYTHCIAKLQQTNFRKLQWLMSMYKNN